MCQEDLKGLFASKCLGLGVEIALSFSSSNARITRKLGEKAITLMTKDWGICGFRAASLRCAGPWWSGGGFLADRCERRASPLSAILRLRAEERRAIN
jgi:hypothetical protein